jgi:peptidoglycan/LPS O-acetylase OafA/YrhL
MLTSIFLVFIGGWLLWFWIDKPPAGQFGLPPPGDSMVQDFQRSIDLLKAGHVDLAYLYVWYSHYLVLSVVLGIILAVLFRAFFDQWSRHGRRRRDHPLPRAGDASTLQRPASPTVGDTAPGDSGANDDAAR